MELMKVKLLKKVRKQYQIVYREQPFKVENEYYLEKQNGEFTRGVKRVSFNYKLLIPNRNLVKSKWDYLGLEKIRKTINDCKYEIIQDLRNVYPNLGNYNRQRKLKEQEIKVWHNGN